MTRINASAHSQCVPGAQDADRQETIIRIMPEDAFICQMCGTCCTGEGGIVLSRSDRMRLCAFLELSSEEFEERYAVRSGSSISLATQEDGACIFFSPESGCRVHSVKPEICRAWPFFLGNLRDEMSWRMAQDYCPGINPGVSHEEFVRQGLAYLRAHGLLHSSGDDGASSLQIGNLLDGGEGRER